MIAAIAHDRRLLRRCLMSSIALPTLLVSGCGKDSTGTESLKKIQSSYDAKFIAADVMAAVLKVASGLSNGTLSARSVAGNSGSASVTGTVSYLGGVSCGTSCLRNTNATTVTIVFSNFAVNTADNTTTTLSGTLQFTDNTWSRQSGTSYSSGGSLCVTTQSTISYRMSGTSASSSFGYQDTITYLNSCGDAYNQSGNLTASAGSFAF